MINVIIMFFVWLFYVLTVGFWFLIVQPLFWIIVFLNNIVIYYVFIGLISIIRFIFDGLAWLWDNLDDAIIWIIDQITVIWDTIVYPAIIWIWDNVIVPFWDSVVVPVFEWIIEQIEWLWNNVVYPAIEWLWDNVIEPIIIWLWDMIEWLWTDVVYPIILWLWEDIILPICLWFYDNLIVPLWENILVPAWEWFLEDGVFMIIEILVMGISGLLACIIFVITLGTTPFDDIYNSIYSLNSAVSDGMIELFGVFIEHLDTFLAYGLVYVTMIGFLALKLIYAKSKGYKKRVDSLQESINIYKYPLDIGYQLLREIWDTIPAL